MKNTHPAIARTKKWLIESVIKYQFCPYAKQPHARDIIGYHVYSGGDIATLLTALAQCLITLDESLDEREAAQNNNSQNAPTLETTLFIVADDNGRVDYLADFYDYLDALDIANDFLATPQSFLPIFADDFNEKYGDKIPETWADKYQLASFHPDYQFENTTAEDRENYTNRSPYPIFHIIRNASIEHVRINDAQAAQVTKRNIQTLNHLSADALAVLQGLAKF